MTKNNPRRSSAPTPIQRSGGITGLRMTSECLQRPVAGAGKGICRRHGGIKLGRRSCDCQRTTPDPYSRSCGSAHWRESISRRLGLESTIRPRGRPRKPGKESMLTQFFGKSRFDRWSWVGIQSTLEDTHVRRQFRDSTELTGATGTKYSCQNNCSKWKRTSPQRLAPFIGHVRPEPNDAADRRGRTANSSARPRAGRE